MAGLSLTPIPVCADAGHPVYQISFAGRGESTTVDEVLVENLSNGKSVSLAGRDTLLLKAKDDLTAIGDVSQAGGEVSIKGGQLVLSMLQSALAQVAVYGVDGTLAWQTHLNVQSHTASLALPPLGKGIYVVRVTAPGLERSVKWLCDGSTSLPTLPFTDEATLQAEETPEVQQQDFLQPLFAQDNAPRFVELEYAKGDVLRFTGTSGQMRTITTNSPRSSHPIYFDFFRCVDATGYNYTIVRAGDMLWMAEDLRNVPSADITEATNLSADVLDKVIGDAQVSLVANKGGTAYYSKAAALKAMPEGWNLPTLGELDYAIKKFNGGNYATAGAYLKAAAAGQVDSTSIGLTAHGRYDGKVVDEANGYLMTRSTKGGVMQAMQVSGNNDCVAVNTFPSCLIPVRGVRAAPSAYTEMMEKLDFTTKRKVKETPARARLQEEGPLGKTYTMYTKPQSIAYDYTGGQYETADPEARSGILYKVQPSRQWIWEETRDDNFLSDCCSRDNKSKLRKMAAMANGQGTESVVEMQWSRPFRVVTQLVNGKYKRTDTPDVFSPKRNGDGVYITITGDSTDNYVLKNKPRDSNHKGFFINLNAYLKPLSKSILPYFLWDDSNRSTETRMDYVQRVFQLLTADFNQDGVDELVIGIDGEVWVYDGATMLNALAQGKVDDGVYKEAPLYHKNFNFKPGTETYKDCSAYYLQKPMTRFAVGDVDGDNTADIVVLQVGDGGKDKAKTELIIYSAGNVEAAPIASRCLDEQCGRTVFTDVKVGNVSNGQYNDIIMLFRSYSGTALEKFGRLWRAMYNPVESNGQLTIDRQDSYNVHSFRGYDGHIGNTNITLAHFRGNEHPYDVVVGADMWRWNPELERLQFKFQVLPFTDDNIWSIYADNIIAADPEGTGRDFLYYYRNWTTYDRRGQRYMLQGFSETYFKNRSGDVSADNLIQHASFNADAFKYCDKGSVWSNDKKNEELMWWFGDGDEEWGSSSALCAVHSRPGFKQFRYRGYEPVFSEPRIHALIAAPPTFDYGDDAKPDYDFVTTWGKSSSTSAGTAVGSSISASTIVGFEHEFNAPITGTKLGGVEFTATMQTECSKSTSQTSTISYSQVYEARDDDRVVMQVTPYDNYAYEVVASDNVDAIGGLLNLSIPQKTITVGVALSDYDRYMGDAKGVPNLHEVFAHKIGDPFSYPSTPEQIRTNVPNAQIMWGEGRWNDFMTTGSGGSVIREISLDEATATSSSFSFSVETELVVTAGCAKAGYGFGYGNTNETTHEESKGFSVSACVPGLAPGDRSPNRTFFNWNLCWYKYTLNGQTFPVVNYVVKRK